MKAALFLSLVLGFAAPATWAEQASGDTRMPGASRAGELLGDSFKADSLSADWEAPDRDVKVDDGRVVFTGGKRNYVRSAKTDWAKQSFRAEVTVKVAGGAGGCAFFGFGQGTTGGDPHGNPNAVPSLYLLCAPSEFAEGTIDLRVGGTIKSMLRPGPGTGTHRLRLTWDAKSGKVFAEVCRNWKGGEFKRDDLLSSETAPVEFSPGNARLFFGGAGDATFENLVVTAAGDDEIARFADDFFAEIAKQKIPAMPGIEGNPPPKLPDIVLPWDTKPGSGFVPANKIDTQAELDAELVRMRTRFAPFMADHAPKPPATRRRTYLKEFEFRLVSQGDRPVQREWEKVAIPHYGGPINKAEAHYRTGFTLHRETMAQDALFLHFQAVDYIAEVHVNGREVGRHEGLFGAFEFDIKPFVRPGRNELLVKVFNDALMTGDIFNPGRGRQFGKKLAACGGIGWDSPVMGWHMCPPGMGIYQPCWLEARPSAFIKDVFVRPLPDLESAEVRVEMSGRTDGTALSYSLYGQNFEQTVAEDQAASATTFTIPMKDCRRWSQDEPWLYQIQVRLKRDGKVVDAAKRQFGMRTFVQSDTSVPKDRFYLNGKEIKLRGANQMGNLGQCVIRGDLGQLRDDILIAKIANMTFWRLTQQPLQEEVYDYFDKLGMLAQTDMPAFCGYRHDCVASAQDQLGEMIRLVRGHPSNALVSYLNEPGFDKPAMLDRAGHTQLFRDFDAKAAELNPDQVIKWVDGDYVNLATSYSDHHDYGIWYGNGIKGIYSGGWHGTRAGWMFGCGEFGAEGLDSVALMKKYYPEDWLAKSDDAQWSPARIPRCQTASGRWQSLTTRTMDDWVRSNHDHQYWGVRLMAESLRRMPRMNSFAVHLLIDAWPAGWLKSIMDCDRQAKPAYFAYRDALTPLAANLKPDRFHGFGGDRLRVGAWVCNDTTDVPPDATLRYQVELDGKAFQTGRAPVGVKASEPVFAGYLNVALPDVVVRRPVTVRLGLFNKAGKLLHDTAVEVDVFPVSEKGKALVYPSGSASRLLSN